MIYKLENPLKVSGEKGVLEINEINLDVSKLTLKDLTEIEFLYYKDNKNDNIPTLSKKMSVLWYSKVLEQLLIKQYPSLAISSSEIRQLSGNDAQRIIFSLESQYLTIQAELFQEELEQILLAKELEKDDTDSISKEED